MTQQDRRPSKDFVAAWRSVDQSMQSWPVPARLDGRILGDRHGLEPRWLWWLAFGLAMTAAVWWLRFSAPAAAPADAGRVMVTFSPARCGPSRLDTDLRLAAGCSARISTPALSLTALKEVHLRRTTDGITFVQGVGRFEIAPNRRGPPVVLRVSGGHIHVLGTQFTVRQDSSGGEVSLASGNISFVGVDGATSALRPGDRLNWRPSVNWPSARTAARVRAIADLRAQGRYAEAEAEIRAILRAPIDLATAEVLSYERGTLLDGPLRRPDDACAHWQAHTARFPSGRYEAAVEKARERCR